MVQKYVVKDFNSQEYYCGSIIGWEIDPTLCEYFDSIEDAETFIKKEDGIFQIELVYIS
jgi:hypothetical protein